MSGPVGAEAPTPRATPALPPVDVHGGIDAAFRAAAVRDPERDAVVTAVGSTTMRELGRAVDDLASSLAGIDARCVLVTPRDPVALAAGVLAAARCDAAAVVADAGRPQAVLHDLAVRVGASAVVTDTSTPPERLPPSAHRAAEQLAEGATVWVPTSGTTGDPGLVGIGAEALLAMAVEAVSLGIVGPGDRVARIASHLGIGPLLTALVLDLPYVAIDVRRLTPSTFLPYLAAQRVTYLHLAPTLLRALLPPAGTPAAQRADRECTRAVPSLRLVGSGGEALRWSDVERVYETLGEVEVLHTYSSTEAGIVTMHRIRTGEPFPKGAELVPVGSTVPGRQVRIVSDKSRPAAVGEVGEIVVDGRFGTVTPRATLLPDGRRRLRTGDLGLLDEDGRLTLHGRAGRDGKVGMWRIDLAAVESALAGVAGVRDVAVRSDHARRLVAHVVIDKDQEVDDARLHAAVGALSPAAVPHRIVRHRDALPTLTSGKVDGRGLEDRCERRSAPGEPR